MILPGSQQQSYPYYLTQPNHHGVLKQPSQALMPSFDAISEAVFTPQPCRDHVESGQGQSKETARRIPSEGEVRCRSRLRGSRQSVRKPECKRERKSPCQSSRAAHRRLLTGERPFTWGDLGCGELGVCSGEPLDEEVPSVIWRLTEKPLRCFSKINGLERRR